MAYNFLYFISGTVKFYTDDIFNKSVVSRITGISFHSNHVQTIEREVFNKEKKRKIVLGKKKKKVKQIHGEKNSSVAKFQNLIGKTILVCPGETFTDYVPNCIQICRRNTELSN